MRILFIHNTYRQRGGEDVAVELETTLLKERGHEVELILFNNDSTPGILSKIKSAGKAIYNKQSAKKITEAIRAFRPDVMHVHNWFFQASPSIVLAAAKEGVPVVMTLHNYRLICPNALLLRNNQPCELCVPHRYPPYGIKYKCYRGSSAETALVTAVTGLHKSMGTWQQKVSAYITLTAFARSKFLGSSLQVHPDKLVLKPNFIPDPGASYVPREDFFLFAGRLSPEKGVHIACEAFASTGQQLVIVGAGEELAFLQKKFAAYHNINFAGKKSREELMDLMKRCRALIFPSIWYEGLPFTILEAFATGTPVVASRLGSMAEMITDGWNGFLFEPGNDKALAASAGRFDEAGNGMASLYENARQTYLNLYHPDIHYASIIKIYEQVLSK